MTQRNRGTGRYTDTNPAKLCTCGHPLGTHTAERLNDEQPCLVDRCPCQSFRMRQLRASTKKEKA
jgi:hypothetical protein